MALDATVKGTSANSYVTVANGDTWMAERLFVTDWTGADTPTKESALIWATALLDAGMIWDGVKTTEDQRLRWPRFGVLNQDGEEYDQDTIPDVLAKATTEFAMELIKRDRGAEPGVLGLGLSEIKAGTVEMVIESSNLLDLIPSYIVMILSPIGMLSGSAKGGPRIENVPLRRV